MVEIKKVGEFENSTDNSKKVKNEDYIELSEIFKFFYRNKSLFILSTLLSTFIGGINLLFTKSVWQGEFQIVLEQKKPQGGINLNSRFSEIAGVSASNDPLKTEVAILKSPLVLMDVFEYVKQKKEANNDYSMDELTFKKWKINQLDIGLEKGTSILNLSYRDTYKELVIPTLNLISNNYQDYSGRKKERGLKLGLDYYEEQIKKYKKKTIDSLRIAQDFATKNDLAILIGDVEIDKEIQNKINIEFIRIQSANDVRNVELQLEQIEKLNKPDELLYFGTLIPGLMEQNLPQRLKDIEERLSYNRLFYKENDIAIKDLIKQRESLIKIFKQQAINFLKARKIDALARLKAAERPSGVLTEYRMLISEHIKDRETLKKLEEENRLLLLEKAKSEDPWELITKSNLLPKPVAPVKRKVLALSLIIGFILGNLLSLIYEKRKGILYSSNEIRPFSDQFLVWESEINDNDSFSQSIQLFINGPIQKTKGDITFFIDKKLSKEIKEKVNLFLSKNIVNRSFKVSKNITEAINSENFVFITGFGIINKKDMVKLLNNVKYQNILFKAVILLSDLEIKNNQIKELNEYFKKLIQKMKLKLNIFN